MSSKSKIDIIMILLAINKDFVVNLKIKEIKVKTLVLKRTKKELRGLSAGKKV